MENRLRLRKVRNLTSSLLLLFTSLAVIATTIMPSAITTVWADNFFGTSGPDTIDGTDHDDNIFGKEGNDDLNGEGGDDYIEGNEGNDEINDGPGSDNIRAGKGDDEIELEGDGDEGIDEAHGGKGKDNIVNHGESGF